MAVVTVSSSFLPLLKFHFFFINAYCLSLPSPPLAVSQEDEIEGKLRPVFFTFFLPCLAASAHLAAFSVPLTLKCPSRLLSLLQLCEYACTQARE